MDDLLSSFMTAARGGGEGAAATNGFTFPSLFGGTSSQPSMFGGGSTGIGYAGDIGNSIADIYGNYQSNNIAQNNNAAIQSQQNQQSQAIQTQLAAMQAQAAQQRQAAQQAYDEAKGLYSTQNQGLQGNIDTMTSNLTALNDPNSPYMQMARQAIERKDAAAGRRSQWGERETQLAGTLADYVGKYAPGINNSITSARDEINKNNNSLAAIYENMNKSGSLTDVNITNLINAINSANQSRNTTGMSAANQANSAQNGLATSGMNAAGGLIKALMGSLGGGGSSGGGVTDWANGNASQMYGISGLGGNIGSNYGFTDQNYGPTFGGGSISSGLNAGANPYGDYQSLMGNYGLGGYSSGFGGLGGNIGDNYSYYDF